MAGGRPTDYKEEYITTADTYLELRRDQIQEDKRLKVKLPTVEGFAQFIGVNKTTLYEWESKHKEFSNALDKIRTEQMERLINSGLSGEYNPTIAKLVLSANHGMREKSDVTTNDKDLPIPILGNALHDNNGDKESSTA